MKIYILLLLSSTFILLGASEPVKVTVTAFCYDSRNVLSGNFFNSDSRKEEFMMTLNSNKLDESKEAIQDNTGGYVDIPEEKFAFISEKDTYRIHGNVERSRGNNTNQFTSTVYNNSENIINTKELYALKESKNLKLIQKINLQYKNNKTNIINIYFDKHNFDQEHQKCEEQTSQSVKEFYLQFTLLICLLIGILYFFIKKFKR